MTVTVATAALPGLPEGYEGIPSSLGHTTLADKPAFALAPLDNKPIVPMPSTFINDASTLETRSFREEVVPPTTPGDPPIRRLVPTPLRDGGVYRAEVVPPATPGGPPIRRLIPIPENPKETYRTEIFPPATPGGKPVRIRVRTSPPAPQPPSQLPGPPILV